MYQSMIQIAEEYDCDVVMCDCVKEHKDEQQIYTHDIRAGYYNRTQIEKEYFPHLLMMENIEYPPTISNWLCLFKRVLIEEEKFIMKKEYVIQKIYYLVQRCYIMQTHFIIWKVNIFIIIGWILIRRRIHLLAINGKIIRSYINELKRFFGMSNIWPFTSNWFGPSFLCI